MSEQIKLLECTLRDGGFGLEDAYYNGISDTVFAQKDIVDMAQHLTDSKVEIIELGAIEISKDDKRKFAIYQNVEAISERMPETRNPGQLYVGMFRGPDTPIEDIPQWRPGLLDGLRVILRYSELQKSLDFCAALAEKGYKVFVQPMLTMRYTEEEIDLLIKSANDMDAYALYFVDSYGYMDDEDVVRFFHRYNAGLKKSIRIGFHAHNNMNLGLSNAKAMLRCAGDREIIIDSCIMGMGQGAGNLQTEMLAPELMKVADKDYDYNSLMEVCEILEPYAPPALWGYSVARMLPALYKTAYKYAVAFRHIYHLTYPQINKLMQEMPADMRHRYTAENARLLLEQAGLL